MPFTTLFRSHAQLSIQARRHRREPRSLFGRGPDRHLVGDKDAGEVASPRTSLLERYPFTSEPIPLRSLFELRLTVLPIVLELLGRELNPDRQSVVSGKSVSVRVDLGGRGIIKKKKKITNKLK